MIFGLLDMFLAFGAGVSAACGAAGALSKLKRTPPIRYLTHDAVERAALRLADVPAHLLQAWHDFKEYPHSYASRGLKVPPPEPAALPAKIVEVARGGLFGAQREAWLVTADRAVREADGVVADEDLEARLRGILEVAEARNALCGLTPGKDVLS